MHTSIEMDQGDCKEQLETTPIGRLAFNFAGKPMVLPVAYRYVNGQIVFRTSLGRKLHAVASDHPVAFEIDLWNPITLTGWSVLAVGSANEIEDFEEFEDAESLGLHPWVDEEDKDRWVRIVPDKITGRRIAIAGM